MLSGQPVPAKKEWVVVIDAGHGGKDPGSIGYTKSKEKNITLSVALKTGKYIKENLKDVRVIYTRDEDKFIGLDERAEIANRNKADIFISIHTNAIDDRRPAGAETWILGQSMDDANLKVAMKENAVITFEENYQTKYEGYDPNSVESFIIFSLMQNTYLKQSTEFASMIQNQFRDRVGRKDRGVKQAGFVVLWRTTMPSVLVELGFISHPEEEKYLLSQDGQDYLASAIFRAFRDYKHSIDNRSGIKSTPGSSNSDEQVTRSGSGEDTLQSTVSVTGSDKTATDKTVQTAGPGLVPASQPSEIKTSVNQAVTPKPAATKPAAEKNGVVFMVQIAAVPGTSRAKDEKFQGVETITRLSDGDRIKYGAGKFADYEDAVQYRRSLTSEYPDAFVIAVRDGRIIPLREAINEVKKKKN